MSEVFEYYTFTPKEMIPEGRRVFALNAACNMFDVGASPTKIVRAAKLFEEYLLAAEAEKPKPKLLK